LFVLNWSSTFVQNERIFLLKLLDAFGLSTQCPVNFCDTIGTIQQGFLYGFFGQFCFHFGILCLHTEEPNIVEMPRVKLFYIIGVSWLLAWIVRGWRMLGRLHEWGTKGIIRVLWGSAFGVGSLFSIIHPNTSSL